MFNLLGFCLKNKLIFFYFERDYRGKIVLGIVFNGLVIEGNGYIWSGRINEKNCWVIGLVILGWIG